MDTFTVAPELEGTKGDVIAARIEVPILVVMIYGIVEFIRLGWSQDYYLYTYALLGGVAASVGLFTYFFLVSVERKKSRKNLLGRVDGFDQDEAECESHEGTVISSCLLAA
jgi:hypothetical protein